MKPNGHRVLKLHTYFTPGEMVNYLRSEDFSTSSFRPTLKDKNLLMSHVNLLIA